MSEVELGAFQDYVKARMRSRRWSVIRLSQESGISDAVIYRWLRENEPKRPSDANLKKLAPVLDASYEGLLRLAGYLPGEPLQPDDEDPDLAEVKAAWPRLPDGLREAIRILVSAGGRVSGHSGGHTSGVSAASTRVADADDDLDGAQNPTLIGCKSGVRTSLTFAPLAAAAI